MKYKRYKKYYIKYYSNPIIREKMIDKVKNRRKQLRNKVMLYYSGGNLKCIICGYSDERALCLEHINNDGAEERRKHRGRASLYKSIIDRNFPNLYQVLCANCNLIKQIETYK